MLYNVPYRYEQALDTSSLTDIRATLGAIEKAIDDCRNAGVHPDSDPAVVLLARHLATVSTNRAPDEVLQHACRRNLEETRRFPALLSLALRGVDFDASGKARFHKDGSEALTKLARALGLPDGSYEIRSWIGDISMSGTITLAAPGFIIELAIGGIREGREAVYRTVGGDGVRGHDHYARINQLLKADRFAEKLHRDLKLPIAKLPVCSKLG